ncbi:hypothetical protein VPH35_120489 [Triticum aestivum]
MRLSFSPSRIAHMIDRLDPDHQKAICTKTGLGGLTQMKSVLLRRITLVLLAKSYIRKKQSIHIAAPTVHDYVDAKYFVLVQDVARIPYFNWGCFTLNDLLTSINTFNYVDQVNLQGNLALLQFWYWEHIRAGSLMYSRIPRPLMARWDEATEACIMDWYLSRLDFFIYYIYLLVLILYILSKVITKIGDLEPTNITNDQHTNKDTHAHEDASYQPQPRGQTMSSQQMDMIFQTQNDLFAEQEKKLVKQVVEVEHKLDKRIITVTEDVINIRGKIATQARLSKLENEVGDLKRELQEQEQPSNDKFSSTPVFDAWKAQTSAGTPSAKPVVQNKELDQDIPPRKPVFNNAYILTDEDYEAELFIRGSHDLVELVHIEDIVLTVHQLKPNVSKLFFVDDIRPVINAYAHISNVATDATSFISTIESRRLLGEFGGIPMGCKSPHVANVATKFVGRKMVRAPMNMHNMHWLLLLFNLDKEEIQVLNSIQAYRDIAKKTALESLLSCFLLPHVESIQACINEAVEDGLVTPPKPINITQWKTTCYTNIPQQTDGYSCGAYTLKYMLTWDGDKITEDFTQAEIHIFSWQICSSLLRSDCNKLRKKSYKNPIEKDEYEANFPEERKGADDDVTIVSNPDVTNKPDIFGAPKRKRGRPRKNAPPSNPVKQQFDTETIAKQVESKRRKRKPSNVVSSPFVQP